MMLGGALALPLAGCNTDKVVAVDDPSALRPEEVNNAASVPALVNGAFRQFVGGYSGFGGDAFLSGTALITDEFYWGDTFTTRIAVDSRRLQPPALGNLTDAAYVRLHQARFNARRAFEVVERFSTAGTAAYDAMTKAQLRTIEGYVFLTLSEGWCGAVPFSRLPDTGPVDVTDIEFGVAIGTKPMNDSAVVRFNEANALSAGNLLAAIGKGRALLNLGRFADAAAAVQGVPTGFVFLIEHSSNQSDQNNPINALQANGRYGVSNLEGASDVRPDTPAPGLTATSAEGLAFRGLRDPRIPWSVRPPVGNCFSSRARCFLNDNYPDFTADIPLASGVEARLIEAEAALQRGNPDAMLEILNELRASATALIRTLYPGQRTIFVSNPLAPLADPATGGMTTAQQFAARRDLLFRERALWLFNTGHRLGDLRRLVRDYGLPSSQVFPSGPYFRGGTYGNDVAFPVPFDEENNPKFVRAACVTTTA